MLSRSRILWLILLLLFAAAAPGTFDVAASADGWEQLDEARFEALPVTRSLLNAPRQDERRAVERNAARPARFAEAEIFRPPIG